MDIDFITDPELAPRPRSEMRITDLTVQAYPDNRRVMVKLALTPFSPADRPNLEIGLFAPDGRADSTISVIEVATHRLALTSHIRSAAQPHGTYTVRVILYYEIGQAQDIASATVTLAAEAATPAAAGAGQGEEPT
jgi:hypothetical protein